MFGDILSDEASGLIGWFGLAPGAKVGRDAAIFEAVHSSAPDIAGQGIANPSALLLAGCVLLDHIGQPQVAATVGTVPVVVPQGELRTPELHGAATTAEFVDQIVKEIG